MTPREVHHQRAGPQVSELPEQLELQEQQARQMQRVQPVPEQLVRQQVLQAQSLARQWLTRRQCQLPSWHEWS